MAGNDVRIEQKDLRTARVFIDGNEVKGVQNVNYSIGISSTPIIRLEFIPETLNSDKDLKVQNNNGEPVLQGDINGNLQINFDDEKIADKVLKQINKKSRVEKSIEI